MCDANFNIVKSGYGETVTHMAITSRVVRSANHWTRSAIAHSDPIYGNVRMEVYLL